MRRRSKITNTLEQHVVFGDEDAARLQAEIAELKASMAELSAQVSSQFTTIAAHAEIARQQVDFARNEAHANLERTRDMLIGLLEQVRAEPGYHQPGSAPGPSALATIERLHTVEAQLAKALETTDACFHRQNELADTMAAFIDTMMFTKRDEPVTGLALR
jgi:N-formylglutamate amidohydrolase